MYITKAIKITMDKASKVAKDTFKNPEKLKILKEKLSRTVNSQNFKDLKIIFETGAAVGGVIMVLEHYYNPPLQADQIEEFRKKLEEKIDSKIEEIKSEILNDGLKAQQIETETIQKNDLTEKIKNLELENKKNKKIIENNQKTLKTVTGVATAAMLLLLISIIKPTRAFEIIEESLNK